MMTYHYQSDIVSLLVKTDSTFTRYHKVKVKENVIIVKLLGMVMGVEMEMETQSKEVTG